MFTQDSIELNRMEDVGAKIEQVHLLQKLYLLKFYIFSYITYWSVQESEKFNAFITISGLIHMIFGKKNRPCPGLGQFLF